jgi:hypothetical protein
MIRRLRHLAALIVTVGLLLLSSAAQMQDGEITSSAVHTLQVDGIEFQYPESIAPNVNVYHSAGFPPDELYPNGTTPRHIQLLFYGVDDDPPSLYQTQNRIVIYRVADFAGYESDETITYSRLDALRSILNTFPELSAFEVAGSDQTLPILPVILSPQVLRARAEVFETRSLVGIRYLTAYPADLSRPLLTVDFAYAFMALSKDGDYLIAGAFAVAPEGYFSSFPPLPEEGGDEALTAFYREHGTADEFEAAYEDYAAENIVLLNAADSFTPSLDDFAALIESIHIEPA